MKRLALLALIALTTWTVGCRSTPPGGEAAAPETGAIAPGAQSAGATESARDGQAALVKAPVANSSSLLLSQAELAQVEQGSGKTVPPGQSATPGAIAATQSPQAGKVTSLTGRKNPFTPAVQPTIEVRLLARRPANQPLPPLPQVNPGGNGTFIQSSLVPLNLAQPTLLLPGTNAPTPLPAAPPAVLSRQPQGDLPQLSPPAAPVQLPVSPTALAEEIEITGVVRLGNRVAVIVKDRSDAISRTVTVGDRLAGGQVELRRIDTPENQEPSVILVQNGVEVVRAVGV